MDNMEETIATLRGILEEDFGIKTDGDLLRALEKQQVIDLAPFCAEIKLYGRNKHYDTIKKKTETRQEKGTGQICRSCMYDSVGSAMR